MEFGVLNCVCGVVCLWLMICVCCVVCGLLWVVVCGWLLVVVMWCDCYV